MYAIFESTENRVIGYCKTREEADLVVALDNKWLEYDHYYVEELNDLFEDVKNSNEEVKKEYRVVFNFPLSANIDEGCKEVFDFSELEIICGENTYSPYIGETRDILIKAFSTCILVNVTANNHKEACSKASNLIKELLCQKSDEINSLTIVDEINNSFM